MVGCLLLKKLYLLSASQSSTDLSSNGTIKMEVTTSTTIFTAFKYVHLGMALKTLWIVPRWSGRLERGGYVKGHDPEVSKVQIEDHVFMIWHHMSTWVCGLTRGHMERRRDLFQLDQLQCSHFGFNLTVSTFGTDDTSSKVNGLWREERKETKQSQVLTWSCLWSGSELVVVWIGSGSVWIRVWIGPEVGPHVCVCCSLDAVWQEKDRKVCRQQVYSLAAGQAGFTTYNSISLAVWQLGCTTVAAWLLDCLAA